MGSKKSKVDVPAHTIVKEKKVKLKKKSSPGNSYNIEPQAQVIIYTTTTVHTYRSSTTSIPECFFRNVKHFAGSSFVQVQLLLLYEYVQRYCCKMPHAIRYTAAEDTRTTTKERVPLCSFSWL